jgi:hypothetical protein
MVSDSLINDPRLARAVSNITARSERQPNAEVLQETYVDPAFFRRLRTSETRSSTGGEAPERPMSSRCWALTRRTRPTPS